ncbi:MAG: PqqD family protein [bacterium]
MTDDFTNLYPVHACEFEEIASGLIVVHFRKTNHSLFDRIFFRSQLNKPHKIDLDEIGSFIWKLCDGKNPIGEIIINAKLQFGEKIEPAEQRVLLFINKMYSTKFIHLYKKQISSTDSQ